jgi:two-component system, cell cycle sensor histidine kinase and response regulator CckA
MSDDFDIRCDPGDPAGLLEEIRRRDRIIAALMNQVQRNLNNPDNDFGLLQTTFMLEQEVRHRTNELEGALNALSEAKHEAEASRHRLSAAIGAMSEGFALFDSEDRLVVCNDAYRKLWGFGRNITRRSFIDLLTEVAERYKIADQTWFANRVLAHRLGTGTFEYRYAGRILQIRERKTPDGFTVGLYADITELAELQGARAARQQLLDIIDFLPDATFVVDQEKRVIAWNRAMEEMTGVNKEEIIGQGDHAYGVPFYGEPRPTLLDLFDLDSPELMSRYENFHKQGSTLYGEDFVPSVFGGRGAYLGRMASPLLDREGNQVGAIESLRDLTDRKRAEADVQRMQEQLRQAAKMEAIGRLAGGIAHDFNNQLTIVQGYCNLLLNRLPCGKSDCGREVQEISRAAERSAQLTSQLLAFGRKQVLHSEVLDLREVIAKLRDPLARMIGEDIDISVYVAPDLWTVKTDRNQLEQAIINLAINARDAMPAGGRLAIEARNAVLDAEYVLRHMGASEGPHVCLSVRDTGSGMDEHTQKRIFEPFFTTKPVGAGTGLGLAMVYGFVKQSDGHVEVMSEAGHGSCFDLYFPQATDVVAEELVSLGPPPSGNETILIIEDQEALRELTAHILRTSGYKVLQAADGYSAITINRQYTSTIDLVLCDVVMPGLCGPDVVKQVKLDRPGLKTLYVTGYAERAVFQAIDLGTHVLSKPFTPDTLFRMVREVLDEDVEMCA